MPRRLPQGAPASAQTTERWDVFEIRIRENSVMVLDRMIRNGTSTDEYRERILDGTEIDNLWEPIPRKTFSEYVGLIHQRSSTRN